MLGRGREQAPCLYTTLFSQQILYTKITLLLVGTLRTPAEARSARSVSKMFPQDQGFFSGGSLKCFLNPKSENLF